MVYAGRHASVGGDCQRKKAANCSKGRRGQSARGSGHTAAQGLCLPPRSHPEKDWTFFMSNGHDMKPAMTVATPQHAMKTSHARRKGEKNKCCVWKASTRSGKPSTRN